MSSPRRSGGIAWRRALAAGRVVAILVAMGTACTYVVARPDVLIGTASPTDMYNALGGSMCRLFNLETARHGRRCSEAPSAGSVANIESLGRGRLDIGIVQSDVLADAVAGDGVFAARGPTTDLRVLFAGHDEMLTLVARRDSGVRTVADLRGTRVNLGWPGARERAGMERILTALGLVRGDLMEAREVSAAAQGRAFCAGELDVIVYSVPHPNGLIADVTTTCGGRLVDVSGAGIERMLAELRQYERGVIPGGTYAGNPDTVRTFGVRAVIVAGPRVSDAVAYEMTGAVFDNVEAFRRLHPAFGRLSVTEMVHVGVRAPFHAGALRYYRERGWLP
ncbi:MAG TPA: TAXI family TRAP transporter solute-binding subunit [Candidatus Limnocylindria bacterium]|nr:TAXI family TRAP transporter solute-binding subunit [Candidatus Limnocylindria bacterium]